ncbi:hypothetical protein D3260_16955 [Salinisphaera sp. Q1T1-3]|nr:hypothetical protein D3260_16955 [Salinisphaera sp. Q1T1-3]
MCDVYDAHLSQRGEHNEPSGLWCFCFVSGWVACFGRGAGRFFRIDGKGCIEKGRRLDWQAAQRALVAGNNRFSKLSKKVVDGQIEKRKMRASRNGTQAFRGRLQIFNNT